MDTIQAQYAVVATEDKLQNAVKGLKERNFNPIVVNGKEEALAKIKELIPAGSSVMNGASVTLEQIGYINYLKEGKHGWNNLHEKVLAEKDQAKQAYLRKETTISDYYLGSVHALAETGELLIASNSGSQLASIVYNSTNLIFVVSTQKITSSLTEAFERLEKLVVPLEDARMKGAYGFGTTHKKSLVYHKETEDSGRTVQVILVKEKLGF